jgi:hemoglobin
MDVNDDTTQTMARPPANQTPASPAGDPDPAPPAGDPDPASAGAAAPARSAYDRLGGAAAIRLAVERFYALLLEDPDLRPYFPTDLAPLKRHQVALLTQVLGGPGRYAGRDMAAAHRALAVTDEHFDRVVDYLVATMLILHAPRDIVEAVEQTVAGLRDQIVSAPDPAARADRVAATGAR